MGFLLLYLFLKKFDRQISDNFLNKKFFCWGYFVDKRHGGRVCVCVGLEEEEDSAAPASRRDNV